MTETFTGYVTKYALTMGIEKVSLEETSEPGMVRVAGQGYSIYFHGKDWWRTREEAVKRAEEMREAKIKSLLKALDKIKKIDFEAAL